MRDCGPVGREGKEEKRLRGERLRGKGDGVPFVHANTCSEIYKVTNSAGTYS